MQGGLIWDPFPKRPLLGRDGHHRDRGKLQQANPINALVTMAAMTSTTTTTMTTTSVTATATTATMAICKYPIFRFQMVKQSRFGGQPERSFEKEPFWHLLDSPQVTKLFFILSPFSLREIISGRRIRTVANVIKLRHRIGYN